jgi:hypothetical protein
MAKQTVQGLILEKLDNLEKKIDSIATQTIPKILVDVATNNQEIKDEAKLTSRIHAAMWGGLTLAVAISGVAVAYFKR